MKSFEELKKKKTLIRYLGSEFGTMYFEPDVPRENESIIRHLDGVLPAELLPKYEQIYKAIVEEVNHHPRIRECVFMPNLIEIGEDYIIRPFYVYDIAICDYLDNDDDHFVEPPELFAIMRNIVSSELNSTAGERGIIHKILKRSLLEPTGKTIYDFETNKFIIVEPKILLEDIYAWGERK